MAGSVKDLSKYRFERCSEELENSKILLDSGKFKLSLNRSYYSIFHAMRAVNVLDDFDSSKHSVDIIHKLPLRSAKHETIRIISQYRLTIIFLEKESNSKQRP